MSRGTQTEMPAWNSVIGDAFSVCVSELGVARAGALVAAASVRTTVEEGPLLLSGTLRGTPERRDAEDAASYALWTEIWQGLAQARPSAFLISPQRLVDRASPTTLAYLYAAKRGLLGEFRPKAVEKQLLSAARAALAEWTGIKAFRAEARLSVIGRRSLPLRGLRESLGWVGAALIDEPLLRAHVVLDGGYVAEARRLDPSGQEVASLVLHEEVHGVLAEELDADAPATDAPLARDVNEALTSYLELAAILAARGRPCSPVAVVREADRIEHGYRRQVRALAEQLPDGSPAEIAQLLVRLAAEVLRGATDFAAADALNRLARRRLGVARWSACFAD